MSVCVYLTTRKVGKMFLLGVCVCAFEWLCEELYTLFAQEWSVNFSVHSMSSYKLFLLLHIQGYLVNEL